jgi:hypothetical protein
MARLERSDGVDRAALERLSSEVAAALRRRPAHEERLAGALASFATHSAPARTLLADAGAQLARRKAFDRPLFAAAARPLSTHDQPKVVALLKAALAADEGAVHGALSAACFVGDGALAQPLTRLATNRHAHVAFAAELARVARGESTGAGLADLAPRIKEAHRIALCCEMLLPLVNGPTLHVASAPGLAVLRDSERHLGRWLVLGEVAARAGDGGPLREAGERSSKGPQSAQAAWGFLAWALTPGAPPPASRPSVDLITRLSDRPSASRDMTFLFRLAEARAPSSRALLEGLTKTLPLADDVGVRAAFFLARDHDRADLREALGAAASGKKDQRGVASAALLDLGDREGALASARESSEGRSVSSLAWASLVRACCAGKVEGPILTEANFRRLTAGAQA